MHLSYLFRDIGCMKDSAMNFFELTANPPWILMQHHSNHAFYGALVSYCLFRETGEVNWAERAKDLHSMIRYWSKNGSNWNFEHKCDLLDAEEQFSNASGGNYNEIQLSYTNAIEKAIRHKFVNDAAISSERAADFYCSSGCILKALVLYDGAHAFYFEWGARAKATSLLESIK